MSTQVSGPGSPNAHADGVWSGAPIVKMRENPERMAWVVLLACFGLFVVLLITVPLAMRYGIQFATAAQTATLDPTQGTVLLYQPGATEPIAITELRKDVVEGSTIEAGDGATQATLRLISEGATDEALGSVQLYSGTRLEIPRMRSPMFDMSTEPYQVQIQLDKGQARVFTNSGQQRPLRVAIKTPHGTILLSTGSFQIAVTPEQTDITVGAGSAQLVKSGQPDLEVNAGLRAWMTSASMAGAAVAAAQNLLRNGNFTEPMRDTWESYVIAQGVTPGKVNIMERDGRRVGYFVRQGEDNVPTEVGIKPDDQQRR